MECFDQYGLCIEATETPFVHAALFPLMFLFFAIPVGDGLTPYLIDMTADFVVSALRLTGIPVYREGASFVIPSGSWSVISACSGIRYLMATVTIGMLYAYFNYRSYWRRAAFLALAVVVAVVGNWLRAYLIVMIGHLSGMRLAVGIDHVLYGWVFFGLLIFCLMGIGRLWIEPPGTPSIASPVKSVAPTSLSLALACLSVAGSLIMAQRWVEQVRAHPASSVPVASVAPAEFGANWSGLTENFTAWRPKFIGTPVMFDAWYQRGDQHLGWQVAWYGAQRQGNEVINVENTLAPENDPEWRIRSARNTLPMTTDLPARFETVIEDATNRRQLLIWQWYWTGDRYVLSPLIAKFNELVWRVQGRGNAGASLLVYTQFGDDEELNEARQRLATATKVIAPRLASALTPNAH